MATKYRQEIRSIASSWMPGAGTGQNKGMRIKAVKDDAGATDALGAPGVACLAVVNPISHKESLLIIRGETNSSMESRLLAGAEYARMAQSDMSSGALQSSLSLFSYDMSSPIMIPIQIGCQEGISQLDATAINRFIVCRDVSIRAYLIKMMIGNVIPVDQSESAATVSGVMIFNRLFGRRAIDFLADAWAMTNNMGLISIFNAEDTVKAARFMCWHIGMHRESHAKINVETIPFAGAIISRHLMDHIQRNGNSIDYSAVSEDINKSMRARHIAPFVQSSKISRTPEYMPRIRSKQPEEVHDDK